MVSVPVVPDDTSVSSVFAGSVAVYTWNPNNKSYIVPTSVQPQIGYWVAVISDRTIHVTGTPVTEWDSDLLAGWNMAGSIQTRAVPIAELADDPTGSIVRNAIYHWNPESKSYVGVAALQPGGGYWIASLNACTLSVS